MVLSARLGFLAFILIVLLTGCVEESGNIRSASEAQVAWDTGAGKLTIDWEPVMAESFTLYMSTKPGTAKKDKEITNVANPIQITDLRTGQTYYFELAALNDEKVSIRSNEIAHTVKGPDDRISLPFSAKTTSIKLAWDDSEEAASYNIYWRNSQGVTRQNGIKIPNIQNPHSLVGLISGVTYYFVITANGKSGGESDVSEEIAHRTE